MTSDEIRERYLSFFEERGHLRIPRPRWCPPRTTASVLLTVAGMQPLKPYFLGRETPPAPRLTAARSAFARSTSRTSATPPATSRSSRCSATSRSAPTSSSEAIEFAWELSREVFGFAAEDIWVTVFEGDEELGLGPDEEAIELWRAVGVPRERIVGCPRSENFWEAGPDGPERAVLGAVPRPRRRSSARPTTCRAARTSASWSTGTSCSCSTTSSPRTIELERRCRRKQHRHRPRAQPHGRDPAGQALGVRDRPVPAADRARRASSRARATARSVRQRPRAADPRRPRPRDDLPDRRRGRALQRGARLRAAARDAPRDPAGPRARDGAGLPRALRRASCAS